MRIETLNIRTGVITYSDGSRKKFNKHTIAMLERMIYSFAKSNGNFDTPDLSDDVGVEAAFDLISKGDITDG